MDCSFDSDDGADSCLEESDFTSISRRGPNAATTECFVVYANITIEVSGCVDVDVDVDFFFSYDIVAIFHSMFELLPRLRNNNTHEYKFVYTYMLFDYIGGRVRQL
jgi:hypothetical protein